MAITNINTIQVKRCIVDEFHARERTDVSINLTSSKDSWQPDSYALPRFLGDLEAGNIFNEGIEILKFAIKRRKLGEITSIKLGEIDYVSGQIVSFIDNAQANDKYIYSIVPLSADGFEGKPNELEVSSEFVGYWIIDKDEINNSNPQNTIVFDKFIGNGVPSVELSLDRGRIELKTFGKYPQVYYLENYTHRFSLQTVIIPSEFERSGNSYDKILKIIDMHKPMLVKASNGKMFVCELSNPRVSTPMNTWKEHDYLILSVDFTEIMDYDEYMAGE